MQSKKLSTYRLSKRTIEKIKLMSDYDQRSHADTITIAIDLIYSKYHQMDANKFAYTTDDSEYYII